MSDSVAQRSLHVGSGATGVVAAFESAAAAPAAFPTLAELPKLLAAAPHRLMFFAGASAVLLSMLWWACVLGAAYLEHTVPQAPVPAGWAHAVLTEYGMLALFIFGFLLTVFPRWMAQPALLPRAYIPVFAGLFGGYVLAHIGLLGNVALLRAGLLLMLAGWSAALFALAGVLLRAEDQDRHALSCFVALAFGLCGLGAFAAFALGAPWTLAYFAIKVGTFGLLLPVYFTVCHRMLPFFSANVAGPGYRTFRPTWSLLVFWAMALVHLGLELGHRYDLLWLVDIPLALFFLGHWLAWQPWKCLHPGLLAVLYAACAWLPVAFALFAAQSVILFQTGAFVLGRAPLHALTIGFFGSMLVAMVTRVTQGHSGRPLQMGAVAWLAFALLQGVALARLYAEIAVDTQRWLVIAACGWLLAFAPWVARSLWIYATPRADGKPG